LFQEKNKIILTILITIENTNKIFADAFASVLGDLNFYLAMLSNKETVK